LLAVLFCPSLYFILLRCSWFPVLASACQALIWLISVELSHKPLPGLAILGKESSPDTLAVPRAVSRGGHSLMFTLSSPAR
jgi:hypothetical protein